MRDPKRLLIGLVTLAILCVATRTVRVRAMEHYGETQKYEDMYYLPSAEWLKVMSLGHERALADLIWMKALVYFGDEFAQGGTVNHVFRYGEVIVTLDPDFARAYQWVGVAGIYTPDGATVEETRRAIDFLERATRRFPDNGEIAWDAGATIAYELVPMLDDPEEKATLRQRATEHMVVAARTGAGPPWLAMVNASQLRDAGRLEQAARHLEEMYGTVDDENVRARMRSEIASLRSRAHAEAFAHANQEFERARIENYPYLPPPLFLMVGERIDLDALPARGFVADEVYRDDDETEPSEATAPTEASAPDGSPE